MRTLTILDFGSRIKTNLRIYPLIPLTITLRNMFNKHSPTKNELVIQEIMTTIKNNEPVSIKERKSRLRCMVAIRN